MSYLDVLGLSKSFGASVALSDVSLSINSGEVLAVMGENGSGKSTLMRILAGEIPSDAGSMTRSGKAYRPHTPLDARNQGVALIHQELALCPHLSVTENLFLGCETAVAGWLRGSEMESRAAAQLEVMGLMDVSPRTLVKDLPVAQQQIVEICRALLSGASVLLFDEPTSSLGHQDTERLFERIHKLRSEGKAIVYITHFTDELASVADRVAVLRDGELVGERTYRETNTEEIVSLMAGKPVEDLYSRTTHSTGEVLLEVNEVAGKNRPKLASLKVRRGEVVGIAGLCGAGRTELIRILFGLDRAGGGDIKVGGISGFVGPGARWKQAVGMLSEDRKQEGLALALTISENLVLPCPGRRWVNPKRQSQRTQVQIDALRVKCRSTEQPIRELSGGNQQKIALGRILDNQCDLLLLDEPTRGIDVQSKAQIYSLIDDLARQGKAILLISSYLPELLGVCHRVYTMVRGRIRHESSTEDLDPKTLLAWCTEG